jgi:zinc protease
MVNCVFAPEEFEAEKKVVIEELRMGLDSPWGLLLQEAGCTAYKIHPYRNPVIGWLQDVERATDALNNKPTTESTTHPGNATLVLSGDFETDRVLGQSLCEAVLPDSCEFRILRPMTTVEPTQRGEKRIEVQWRSKSAGASVSHITPRDRPSRQLCASRC